MEMMLHQDKDWLERKYWGERLSMRAVAVLAGRSYSIINKWMRKYGIPKRSRSEASKNAAERCELREDRSRRTKLYWSGKRKLEVDCRWLEAKYWNEELNTVQIAEIVGVSDVTIGNWLDGYGIERRTWSEARSGEKASHWQGGISFDPYPSSFNKCFKRKVRERDNECCVVCKLPGRFVHHIDYSKDNTVSENCVTLCSSCHSVTNFNRGYWEVVLSRLLKVHLDPALVDASLRRD